MGIFTRNRKADDPRPTPKLPENFYNPIFWPSFGEISDPVRYITNDNVLGLPACWRALNLIANAVGTMSPPKAYLGDKEVTTPLLLSKPSPDMDAFDYFHMVTTSLILDGNYIAIPLNVGDDGVPEQLLTVPNNAVTVRYNEAGKVVYEIADMTLSADGVLHVRGYTRPGDPWGVGVVSAFRRSVGHSLDRQGSATSAMAGIPSGIIRIKTKEITAAQAALTKTEWMTAFAAGTRTPAVLGENIDFTPISFSAQDSQWIESAQLDIATIAFMFGLDPADLSATVGGSSLTYANIESRAVDRLTNSYGPWVRRIEEAWTSLLPGDQYARMNVERILRTDSTSRATFYETMIRAGVYSPEYCQELERVPAEFRGAHRIEADAE